MPSFDTSPEELLVALCSGEYTHVRQVLEARDGGDQPVGNCCLGVYCRISGVPMDEGDAALTFDTPSDDWPLPPSTLPVGHWLSDDVRRVNDGHTFLATGALDSVLMNLNDERDDVGYDLVIQALCYYLAGEPIPAHLEPLVEPYA